MMVVSARAGRWGRTATVLTLSLALCQAGSAAGADGEVARLLAQAGIRPVEPSSSALTFELPALGRDGALSGATQTLASRHGEWVLLTFFATWCGPCQTELPTLVGLQEGLGEQGLSVLAVSIDSELSALSRYLQETDLDLLVLWDERGRAARQYMAQSIPLSYLIDPVGRIVGVSRGARDWSLLRGLFGELLRLVPPGQDVASAYAEGEGPVNLPLQITPPTAEVHLADSRPRVGAPFALDVEIHWAGNFDEYLLHPPKVALPEGVELQGVSAETGGEQGRSVVTYRIALEASQVGTYALDPVELRYTPRFESSPVSSRIAGPTVEIRPRTIAGLETGTLFGLAGGLLLVAAAGLILLRQRRRRGKSGIETSPAERWLTTLEEARRRRIEGELAASFELLSRLELELLDDSAEPTRRVELEEAIERFRFGGTVPTSEEVDPLLRRLERSIQERCPPASDSERRRIRLRDRAADGG